MLWLWKIVRCTGPLLLGTICVAIAAIAAVAISHLFWYWLTGSVPDGLTIVAGGAATIVALPLVWVFTVVVFELDQANGMLVDAQNELSLSNAELNTARAELEARVEDRTVKLREALQIAQEASASKSVLLANMSHELRTPLNAIIGYAEMLVHRDRLFPNLPGEKMDEYAGSILSSGRRLHEMVSDLLDLTKIEFGQFKTRIEPVSLRDIVEQIIRELRPAADARQQSVRLAMPDGDPVLSADRRAIYQIVINLVSNALKYSDDGATILVRVEEAAEGLQISVKDRGIGMSPDQIRTATEPFSRFSDAHIASGASVGLGLSIVKKLCDLIGGKLTLESEVEVGTVARVALPVGCPQAMTPLSTAS